MVWSLRTVNENMRDRGSALRLCARTIPHILIDRSPAPELACNCDAAKTSPREPLQF